MALIAREGIAAATTRRIAEEAGLPHGVFHYWFAGKEDLLEEVFRSALREVESVAAASEKDNDDMLPEGLLARFQTVFSIVQGGDPGRHLADFELTALALRTPQFRDLARQQYTAYRQTAAAITTPWLERTGAVIPGGPSALARFVAVLFDGLTLAWLADPEGTEPDEVFALVAHLLADTIPGPTGTSELSSETGVSPQI